MAGDTVIIRGAEMHRSCAGLSGESKVISSGISYEDNCVSCGKEVYLAEKVIKAGAVYHRQCLGGSGVEDGGAYIGQ